MSYIPTCLKFIDTLQQPLTVLSPRIGATGPSATHAADTESKYGPKGFSSTPPMEDGRVVKRLNVGFVRGPTANCRVPRRALNSSRVCTMRFRLSAMLTLTTEYLRVSMQYLFRQTDEKLCKMTFSSVALLVLPPCVGVPMNKSYVLWGQRGGGKYSLFSSVNRYVECNSSRRVANFNRRSCHSVWREKKLIRANQQRGTADLANA